MDNEVIARAGFVVVGVANILNFTGDYVGNLTVGALCIVCAIIL